MYEILSKNSAIAGSECRTFQMVSTKDSKTNEKILCFRCCGNESLLLHLLSLNRLLGKQKSSNVLPIPILIYGELRNKEHFVFCIWSFLELVFAFFFSKMRALSPSVYILSSNFPVFEVSSLTFLFNFVTCVLGVFDGQKRAPSVCSFELGV